MKTLKLISLLLFISSALYSQGMYSVASGDGSVVVACGKAGVVIRSTNGGRNWQSSVIAQVDLKSVCSVNNNYWIAGDNRTFFYSSNSGAAWNSIVIAAGSNFNSVCFTDAMNGWIAGDGGTILRSTNGGVSWSQQTSATALKINTIKFLNSSTGVACGIGGLVLKTTNGGSLWQTVTTPTTRELLNIDIKGNSIVVVGEYSVYLRSTNSGSSWTSVNYKISTLSDINSVYMFDENNLFTCGGGGFIRRSTDGGVNYTFPQNPMFGELYSIKFYDQLKGWTVSRKSYAVIMTTDGGSSWQLPEGTTVTYNWNRTLQYGYNQTFGDAISTFNPLNKKVIYTLAANKLYRSPDIGETWTQISTLPYAALFSQYLAINPRDTNKMVALLQYPTRVYYTSNYGTDWILASTPNVDGVGIPIARHPYNPDTLYLGTFNALYKSTNFGLNWFYISTLPISNQGVCDIEINYSNPDIMLLNTKHTAKVFRSTNGGMTFTMTNIDSNLYVYGESPALTTSIFEPQTAYHLFFGQNANQGIFKSTNFGINWSKVFQVTYPWGITYAADDPNVMLAGVWDSTPRPVYITQNGWQSHTETALLLGQYNGNEAIYAYDKGNILLQQTIGIYKMNTTYFVPSIGIQNISGEIPKEFLLGQNYPNPFNPVTKIKFQIPISRGVSEGRGVLLKIYDALGREAAVLVNEELKPGTYEVDWDASVYPSGIYFYSLSSGNFAETKKMVLIK